MGAPGAISTRDLPLRQTPALKPLLTSGIGGPSGIGFLYLLTGGLLWIGTIDIGKYRERMKDAKKSYRRLLKWSKNE